MGTKAREAINRSYRESQRLLAIAGLVSLSLMLIVMWFLKNVKLDEAGGAQTQDQGPTPVPTENVEGDKKGKDCS